MSSSEIIPVERKAKRGGRRGGGDGIGGRFDLSEELLAEILWRLPLKSLFQLKTVCKSWRDFISSPDFLGLCVKITPPSDLFMSNDHFILGPQLSCHPPLRDVTGKAVDACFSHLLWVEDDVSLFRRKTH